MYQNIKQSLYFAIMLSFYRYNDSMIAKVGINILTKK